MAKATRMHSMPPIDTPISQNDAPSRRHFLTQAAGVAAGGTVLALAVIPPALAATAPARLPDPILALIEDHKKANVEYGEVCREVVPGTCSPDPKKEEQYADREAEVRDDLATTVPTTLEGLLAVLTYVEAVGEGKLSAEGRRDNAFDYNLMDIIISAQDCLASHLGVQAA
jgi:hypothetical protein